MADTRVAEPDMEPKLMEIASHINHDTIDRLAVQYFHLTEVTLSFLRKETILRAYDVRYYIIV